MRKPYRAQLIGAITLWLLCSGMLQGQNLDLYLDIARFNNLRNGTPEVQVYIRIPGSAITFRELNRGKFQAKLGVSLLLRRISPEGDTIPVASEHYPRKVPMNRFLPDTTFEQKLSAYMLDVHSYPLEMPGKYVLEVMAVDSGAVRPARSLAVNEFQVKNLDRNTLTFSDVKWVAGVMPRPDQGRRKLALPR